MMRRRILSLLLAVALLLPALAGCSAPERTAQPTATGPAVIDPFAVDEDSFSGAPVESGVSAVSRQALMDALDDTFIFTEFLKDHGVPYTDRDGVYAVCSMQQLAEWQPLLSRGVLYNLAAAGVSIWD